MRTILLYIEELPAGQDFTGSFHDDEGKTSDAELNAHAKILLDEGYIEGLCQKDHRNQPIGFWIRALTMKGHEFLANARNNTVWKKVVAKAEAEGTSISVSILSGLLKKAMEKYVGLDE